MIEKELTWNELADYYDKYCRGGRPARTLPMDAQFGTGLLIEKICFM